MTSQVSGARGLTMPSAAPLGPGGGPRSPGPSGTLTPEPVRRSVVCRDGVGRHTGFGLPRLHRDTTDARSSSVLWKTHLERRAGGCVARPPAELAPEPLAPWGPVLGSRPSLVPRRCQTLLLFNFKRPASLSPPQRGAQASRTARAGHPGAPASGLASSGGVAPGSTAREGQGDSGPRRGLCLLVSIWRVGSPGRPAT